MSSTEIHHINRDKHGRLESIEKPVTKPPNVDVYVDVAKSLESVRHDAYTAGFVAGAAASNLDVTTTDAAEAYRRGFVAGADATVGPAFRCGIEAIVNSAFNAGRQNERDYPGVPVDGPLRIKVAPPKHSVTVC